MLAEALAVAQGLGFNAVDNLLGTLHEDVQSDMLRLSLGHLRAWSVTTVRGISSIQMKSRTPVSSFEDSAEPVDFVRRLQEGMIPEDSRVLLFDDVFDFANR